MGKMCPILNHPMTDGVLINDDKLVAFINKRNVEFLPTELVCISCKREIIKLYNKKIKKALLLQRELMLHGSVSSLEKNKTSSCTSSERSLSFHGTLQRRGISRQFNQLNGNTTKSIQQNSSIDSIRIINTPLPKIISVSETSIIISTDSMHSVLDENQNNQLLSKKTIPEENGSTSSVTIPKNTIRDYFNVQVPKQTDVASVTTQETTNACILRSNASANQIGPPNEDDVIIRFSQEPTTSKAANQNKRPLSAIIDTDDDFDDDDGSLSLNAINGTHFPNIQPIPPKRKPEAAPQTTLQQDIWQQYIKDINGG